MFHSAVGLIRGRREPEKYFSSKDQKHHALQSRLHATLPPGHSGLQNTELVNV